MMHSLIDPAGNEITEHLNIKHENSRTDQVKGYKWMRSCGLHFFYIEKCSDMLEDCINALWDNGVNDDTLSLILY